jgi:drug/metabolite transporter (DMT)-like permease
MSRKWKYFAAGEGFSKTLSNTVSKVIGLSGGTFGTSILATLVIGIVQMLGGLVIALFTKQRIFPGRKLVGGSALFGISAVLMTVAGLYAFTFEEANLGVFVFITFFGLLPGIFIDWIFFKTPLTMRQWIGVFVFLLAGYSMLDFPPLEEIVSLPTWILVAFVIPLLLAFNEGITRGISLSAVSNPFVNNFWIGVTTVITSFIALLLFASLDVVTTTSTRIYLLAALSGCIVLIMISLKLLSYKAGGTIAHKKVIMNGAYLTSAIIIGFVFFGEAITLGKIVGVGGFFISVFLMEKNLTFS